MTEWLRRGWRALRQVSGDDAYERYLAHWREQHGGERSRQPLDRAAFFREQQRRKWDGVNRCC